MRAAFLVPLFLAACAEAPPPSTPPPAKPICEETDPRAVTLANEGDKALRIDLDRAIDLYTQALELAPKEHRIALKLAKAARKKEDWAKAAEAARQATAHGPGFANYWYEWGFALGMVAETEKTSREGAKEAFFKCIAIDPNYADCHAGLALVLLRQDDEKGALASYTRAIASNPKDLRNYASLGDLYIRLDHASEARAVLDQAKAFSDPGDRALVAIFFLSAKVHQDQGDLPNTAAELERAKAVADPEGPEARHILFSLGSTYARFTPPRKAEASDNLRAFVARVCKGAAAQRYRTECETSSVLLQRLGGTP